MNSERPAAVLGPWTCTALVVGNTIGASIFVMPAALAPFGVNALIGWAVTAAGCLALAAIFARMARRYPDAKSPYDYLRATQGPALAFLAVWAYWASVVVGNATIAVAVVGYLVPLAPALFGHVPPPLLALAGIWSLVAVNLAGVRAGGRVQVITTVLKLVPMVAILAVGAGVAVATPAAYAAHPPATPVGLGAIGAAASLALFAMLGLESAAVPAARVRDPARTIPRATLWGTLAAAGIYLAVSAIALLLIPQADLGRSAAPFALLLDRYADGGGRWLSAFVVVSGLGALNGWTLLVGELTRSLAADGYLPRALAKLDRRGAPARALCACAAIASVILLAAYEKSLVQGYALLSLISTAADLPLYLGAALALAVVWRRDRGPVAALTLALAGGVYCLAAFAGAGPAPLLWLLVLLVAGAPFYLLARRNGPSRT
ncbi:MAG: amino acid permease [Caulobacteraceae bacterium]